MTEDLTGCCRMSKSQSNVLTAHKNESLRIFKIMCYTFSALLATQSRSCTRMLPTAFDVLGIRGKESIWLPPTCNRSHLWLLTTHFSRAVDQVKVQRILQKHRRLRPSGTNPDYVWTFLGRMRLNTHISVYGNGAGRWWIRRGKRKDELVFLGIFLRKKNYHNAMIQRYNRDVGTQKSDAQFMNIRPTKLCSTKLRKMQWGDSSFIMIRWEKSKVKRLSVRLICVSAVPLIETTDLVIVNRE